MINMQAILAFTELSRYYVFTSKATISCLIDRLDPETAFGRVRERVILTWGALCLRERPGITQPVEACVPRAGNETRSTGWKGSIKARSLERAFVDSFNFLGVTKWKRKQKT